MLKSNSVPNFFFESSTQKKYSFKLFSKPKIVSYSEFLKNNPNATKQQRREAIKSFYKKLFDLHSNK